MKFYTRYEKTRESRVQCLEHNCRKTECVHTCPIGRSSCPKRRSFRNGGDTRPLRSVEPQSRRCPKHRPANLQNESSGERNKIQYTAYSFKQLTITVTNINTLIICKKIYKPTFIQQMQKKGELIKEKKIEI